MTKHQTKWLLFSYWRHYCLSSRLYRPHYWSSRPSFCQSVCLSVLYGISSWKWKD